MFSPIFLHQRQALFFKAVSHQFGDVGFFGREHFLEHLGYKSTKVLLARGKVGLTVHLDDDAIAAVFGNFCHHQTFGSRTACFFGGFHTAGLAHVFNGKVHVAVGFGQSLLALHHAKACAFTQFFHCTCGNFCHIAILCSNA